MTLLHLLVSLLSLAAVELQTSNMTPEVLRSETFTAGNYTLGSRNETFNLTAVEWRQLEDKFEGRTANETSHVIAEDDEDFQEQETMFSGMMCKQEVLKYDIHYYCGNNFHHTMEFVDPEDWCVFKDIIGPYNSLMECLQIVSEELNCFYPNPYVQQLFISMHSIYFHNCTGKEKEVTIDEKILLTLILVPVSLIPILVFMVVRNSKAQE